MTATETPGWVAELQAGINMELSEDYRPKACYQYDEKFLYVTFPTIPFMQLDIKKGLNRTISKYDGDMSQDPTTKLLTLTFLNPQIKNTAIQPPPPPAPVQTVPGSQTPSYQTTIGECNTTKNTPTEVKNNMSIKLTEYTSSKSKFVSPKNSKITDTFTIKTKPYKITSDFKGETVTQIVCDVTKDSTNEEMTLKINITNARKLTNIFGAGPNDDGEPWINRKVRIDDFKPEQNGQSLVLSPL
jgi:hypothetical protein